MKKAGLVVILLFATFIVQAQVILTTACKQAYNDILSLKFEDARLQLQLENVSNPNNTYTVYLENYIDFLTLFIGENEEDFHFLEANQSNRIVQISKLPDASPYKKYMLGNIYLQWAVARLKFGEYFTAAFEINKAYRLLDANSHDFPEFVPNRISLGVLHILIGMVPDKYQWILNLISMRGSVEQGRTELYSVLQKSETDSAFAYLHDETLFYLGFVEININPDKQQALILLNQIGRARQDNLLLSYLFINMLMKTGQNEKALHEFDKIKDRKGFFPFHYLDYLHGVCFLNKLETNAAREKYLLFLESFSGRNYLKDAWRKIGWTYLIDGDTVDYLLALKQIPELGNDAIDIDRQAEHDAENEDFVPNIDLLKVKLLFDGGYCFQADSLLNKIDLTQLPTNQKLECYYRKARIADVSGSIEHAKAAYLQTIENGENSQRYFAGNAALKLAGIYESEGDLEQAAYFYRRCLKMSFTEYETSIHTKAKAGLKRVTEKQD
jgi:tetratricopeptide (TPR) repeat protein